jgi:hypothetical protein
VQWLLMRLMLRCIMTVAMAVSRHAACVCCTAARCCVAGVAPKSGRHVRNATQTWRCSTRMLLFSPQQVRARNITVPDLVASLLESWLLLDVQHITIFLNCTVCRSITWLARRQRHYCTGTPAGRRHYAKYTLSLKALCQNQPVLVMHQS